MHDHFSPPTDSTGQQLMQSALFALVDVVHHMEDLDATATALTTVPRVTDAAVKSCSALLYSLALKITYDMQLLDLDRLGSTSPLTAAVHGRPEVVGDVARLMAMIIDDVEELRGTQRAGGREVFEYIHETEPAPGLRAMFTVAAVLVSIVHQRSNDAERHHTDLMGLVVLAPTWWMLGHFAGAMMEYAGDGARANHAQETSGDAS